MHPHSPSPGNPLQVASHADRLAREQQGGRLGLAFQGITAISLGVMTTKMVLDMIRDARDTERHRSGHIRR
jgi:hypothetical protein